MATVELVGGCAHSFGQEPFQGGVNGTIFFADDVPAGLRSPGGSSNLCVEQLGLRNTLRCQDQLLLLIRQIAGEIVDAVRKQPDTSVRDADAREDRRHWEVG